MKKKKKVIKVDKKKILKKKTVKKKTKVTFKSCFICGKMHSWSPSNLWSTLGKGKLNKVQYINRLDEAKQHLLKLI